MLNPSTADATVDDPTIRRCVGFAKALECGALLVGNLYAFRATDPCGPFKASEPTGGERNDEVLIELLSRGEVVIADWGAHAKPDRVAEVSRLPGAEGLSALALTKDAVPRHPLYVAGTATPQPWRMAA